MVKWDIEKSKTALLAVDVNNNFFLQGMPFYVPSSLTIVPNLKELIKTCRELKVPVIYMTQAYRPDGSNIGLASMTSKLAFPPKGDVTAEGTKAVEIYDEVKPEKGDIVIKKMRYSSFFNTDLESTLRWLGVDTVIIAGTVTDCCVITTAFDAYQKDIKPITLSDCTAARDDETHRIILRTIARVAGEVTTTSDIIERLKSS
ncbi:MAG: isochorismatase family cysteine hydrolase [Methanobacteriota archaeon]